MVCRIFCPKPLSESTLTYCQLDPLEHFDEILIEIELWNYNWKWAVIIQENAFEHVVCKSAAIWPQPQCVNMYDLKLILNMPHGSFWIWSQPLRGDHDDVIKWKHFPRYWPFVRGIHRSPVNSPPQRPVTRSFDVFFDQSRINGWVNNGESGDLRRHRAHYDVNVTLSPFGWTHIQNDAWCHIPSMNW